MEKVRRIFRRAADRKYREQGADLYKSIARLSGRTGVTTRLQLVRRMEQPEGARVSEIEPDGSIRVLESDREQDTSLELSLTWLSSEPEEKTYASHPVQEGRVLSEQIDEILSNLSPGSDFTMDNRSEGGAPQGPSSWPLQGPATSLGARMFQHQGEGTPHTPYGEDQDNVYLSMGYGQAEQSQGHQASAGNGEYNTQTLYSKTVG